MTKPPDLEGARLAAEVVGKYATPPFRYQVRRFDGTPIALTMTSWTAQVLADALKSELPDSFIVTNMHGVPVPVARTLETEKP